MKSKKFKCRVCLQFRADLKDLSDPHNSISKHKVLLQDAFLRLTGILISNYDPARLICSSCMGKLRTAIEFQDEAKNSQEEIQKQIQSGVWTDGTEMSRLEDAETEIDVKVEDDEHFYDESFSMEEEPEIEQKVKIEIEEEMEEEEEDDDEVPLSNFRGAEFEVKPEPTIKSVMKAEIEFDQEEILRLGLKRYKKVGKKENKKYVCDVCGFETNQEWKVMQHIKNIHMIEIVKPRKKHSNIKNDSKWVRRQLKLGKKMICEHCNATFDVYKDLHTHMRKNHVVLRPFKCPWDTCTKAFCSQLQLDKHVNYRHYSKSMCEVCGINILKSSMKDHLKTHRSDRPFACPHAGCTTAFKDKNGLTQHLACVHNQERKFACHVCGRSYKLSTTLLAHIRVTHTFENCTQCDQCSRWFLNTNQLQIHINQVHLNLRPFPCELCGSSHKSQAKMYRHLRQMHPEAYQVLFDSGKLKCRKRIELKQPQSNATAAVAGVPGV